MVKTVTYKTNQSLLNKNGLKLLNGNNEVNKE